MVSVGFKGGKAGEWQTSWSRYSDSTGFVMNEQKQQIVMFDADGEIKRVVDYKLVRTIMCGEPEPWRVN